MLARLTSDESDPTTALPPGPGRSVQLLVLSATLFAAMAGFSVVIPALGDLALKFGASSFEVGAMTAAYALAQLVFAPLFGVLCDRVGRKPVLVLGLLASGSRSC